MPMKVAVVSGDGWIFSLTMLSIVDFVEHGEMRNQAPSVEMITAQDVDEIADTDWLMYVGSGRQNGQLHVGCVQDDDQM